MSDDLEEPESSDVLDSTGGGVLEADEADDSSKPVKSSGNKSAKNGKAGGKPVHPDAEKMERILDIPLVLSAQLGSTRILVKELLQLGPGSVVELDKLAGEPLEVLVNDKLVARGEVVMVNDKFAVRLTDVVSHTERVQKLR
ncbi:MAG: flagellar motor switch protein FliN [Nitrospirota bacterium]|nr:flagellar motor switch protein FliN [Nitrospirota bacterium]